ncbi:MAG TPA: pirin family protein [Casimicrobium huifangae]|nr:pirin family protein [Casimicrobium huifangae]
MLTIRKSEDRGHADHGWLQSRFSFSFAEYHDPAHIHFGPLRVINDDYIAPGQGFGTHGHKDMEIVTYVLEGAVAHKDSLGNAGNIVPGEVQRMSAGRGIMHSEFNPNVGQRTHLLQIWIIPDRTGGSASYEQKAYDASEKRGKLRLVASPDGAEGSVTIQQNARMYAGLFDGGESSTHTLAAGRLAYVHVARGAVTVNGIALNEGDAVKIENESSVRIDKGSEAEVLLFDLPPLQ